MMGDADTLRPPPEEPAAGDALLELAVEDAAWTDALAPLAGFVARCVSAALAGIAVPEQAVSISLLLTSDAEMQGLNAQFRGKDKATNVLSWPAHADLSADLLADPAAALAAAAPDPAGGARRFMGDVALGFETVDREAAEAKKPLDAHTAHLIVHGVLHLFGFSHEMDEDAAMMEGRESSIMAALGYPDPYGADAAGD